MIGKIARVIGFCAILGAITFTPLVTLAETANKIAVVDVQGAIFTSKIAKNKFETFKESADFIGLQAKYDSASADFQAMAKELDSNRLTWSSEKVAEHQKKMSYVKADAELAIQKITAEQKQFEQRILQELAPFLEQAIQEIVKEDGITMLLRAEYLVLASPESSITQKVADRIDIKSQPKAE